MGETSCRAGPWVSTVLGESGSCLWGNKDTQSTEHGLHQRQNCLLPPEVTPVAVRESRMWQGCYLQARGPCCRNPPLPPPHPSVALLHLCTSPAPLSQSLWSQLCMKCLREGSEALCRLCCRIGRAGGSVLQPWRRGLSGAELAGTRLTAFSLLSLPLPSALQSSDVRCGKTSLFSSPTQGVGSAAHTAPCCSHCQHSTQALVPPQAPAVRFHACQQELPLP